MYWFDIEIVKIYPTKMAHGYLKRYPVLRPPELSLIKMSQSTRSVMTRNAVALLAWVSLLTTLPLIVIILQALCFLYLLTLLSFCFFWPDLT
jgi:hypothetical protein